MFSSALVLVAQAIGIIVFSAVSILLVWVVCGVVFCAVTCGFSCGCCGICQAECPVRDQRAVYVTAVGESRSAERGLLLRSRAKPR